MRLVNLFKLFLAMSFTALFITSSPIGNTLILERVSPDVIVVATPDILVVRVDASGAYDQLVWQTPPSSPSGYFVNFYETYIQEETSEADLGVYRVDARPTDPAQTMPVTLVFTVTPHSE